MHSLRGPLLALTISGGRVTEDNYLSWLVLRWDMEMLSGWPAFYWTRLTDASPGHSPLEVTNLILQGVPLNGIASAGRFLVLVNSVAPLITAIQTGLAERGARGIRLPKFVIPRSVAYIRSFISPPGVSPFALPAGFTVHPDTLWQVLLEREVTEAIGQHINPALEQLGRAGR